MDVKDCFDEIYDLIDFQADCFPNKDCHYVGVDPKLVVEPANGKPVLHLIEISQKRTVSAN